MGSLTNLACSVRRYFGLEAWHKGLPEVDRILAERKPRNVVVILFDGMGENILRRTLGPDEFFVKHDAAKISSVFPATTSLRTGLNPAEHGWLGWNMYVEPADETITLFRGVRKEDGEASEKFSAAKKWLVQETTAVELNKKEPGSAVELFPFGEDPYDGLDEMFERILNETKKPGQHYIHAYDSEPDGTMHEKGPDSAEVRRLIQERSRKVAEFCGKLDDDTLVIVTADHGHRLAKNVPIDERILEMLERTTALEERTTAFKVKPEKKVAFQELFNDLYGEWFKLYTAEEVIQQEFFGEVKAGENKLFRAALGDFVAVTDSEVCLVAPDDEVLVSNHAGRHPDEIYVPIIIN